MATGLRRQAELASSTRSGSTPMSGSAEARYSAGYVSTPKDVNGSTAVSLRDVGPREQGLKFNGHWLVLRPTADVSDG